MQSCLKSGPVCALYIALHILRAEFVFSVLLPVGVTCIEKLNPITMFHMKDVNELGYNIASSYYP